MNRPETLNGYPVVRWYDRSHGTWTEGDGGTSCAELDTRRGVAMVFREDAPFAASGRYFATWAVYELPEGRDGAGADPDGRWACEHGHYDLTHDEAVEDFLERIGR